MQTTNMSTRDSFLTYIQLTEECEKLLEKAKKLKEFSRNTPSFDACDPGFQKLAVDFREQLHSVQSLFVF
jgi:hypothetical protein